MNNETLPMMHIWNEQRSRPIMWFAADIWNHLLDYVVASWRHSSPSRAPFRPMRLSVRFPPRETPWSSGSFVRRPVAGGRFWTGRRVGSSVGSRWAAPDGGLPVTARWTCKLVVVRQALLRNMSQLPTRCEKDERGIRNCLKIMITFDRFWRIFKQRLMKCVFLDNNI